MGQVSPVMMIYEMVGLVIAHIVVVLQSRDLGFLLTRARKMPKMAARP